MIHNLGKSVLFLPVYMCIGNALSEQMVCSPQFGRISITSIFGFPSSSSKIQTKHLFNLSVGKRHA